MPAHQSRPQKGPKCPVSAPQHHAGNLLSDRCSGAVSVVLFLLLLHALPDSQLGQMYPLMGST